MAWAFKHPFITRSDHDALESIRKFSERIEVENQQTIVQGGDWQRIQMLLIYISLSCIPRLIHRFLCLSGS